MVGGFQQKMEKKNLKYIAGDSGQAALAEKTWHD